MKDKQCIHCNKLFECKSKPTKNKCVSFEKIGYKIPDRKYHKQLENRKG